MPVIETVFALRATYSNAKLERYMPTAPLTATNVQDAIDQAVGLVVAGAPPTATNVSSTPYTVTATDLILLVDTSIGAVTVNMLPAASHPQSLKVKDKTGNANVNPISVVRSGAETIDGLTTYPIDAKFGVATFYPQTGGYYVGD